MASSSNSADIGIRVFLEDAASRGLYSINSSLGSIGSSARTAGLLFGDFSSQLAGMAVVAGITADFALFTGGMYYAVQQAMDLQQALTNIALATGATTDQMNILKPFLINLGADSIYSLQQLSEGIAVVGQYGFKTTQQIEDLSSAGVQLAEATGTTTTDAFKLLAVTMDAFQIPASQAQQTAQLLFYSMEHGTPNVSSLTTAIGQLGGVADVLHIPLQDIVAVLDTVSIGMGSTSTAAAGLRYMLTTLTHPATTKAADEIKNLGLVVFDAQGQFVGLAPLLQQLNDKLAGLSDKAKADILGNIFNVRGSGAVKQILDSFSAYEQNLKNVNDQAQLAAQFQQGVLTVMGQLSSVIHVIVSNFQDFAAFVGGQLIPMFTPFLGGVSQIVTRMRLWAEDPAHALLVARFMVLGAVITGLGLIIIGAVLSPIVLFIVIMVAVMAAMAGVTIAVGVWGKSWEDAAQHILHLQGVMNTINALIAVWRGTVFYAQVAWSVLLPAIQQAAKDIGGTLHDAIKQLQPVWQQLLVSFRIAEPTLRVVAQILGFVGLVLISVLVGAIRAVIVIIGAFLQVTITVLAGIAQAFAGVVQFIMGFLMVIRGLIVGIGTGNWQIFTEGAHQMKEGIINIWNGLVSGILGILKGLAVATWGALVAFVQGVIGFFVNLADRLVGHSIWTDMLYSMLQQVLSIGPNIMGAFNGFIQNIIQLIQNLPGRIQQALGNLGGLLTGAGQALIQGFINGIESMINNAKNSIGGLLNAIRNLFPHSPAKEGPLMDAHLWMPNLVHMLADTAETAGPSLKSSMGRVAGGARDGLGVGPGRGAGGPGTGEIYNLNIDGKAFMSFFHDQITGQLQANGVGRMLR